MIIVPITRRTMTRVRRRRGANGYRPHGVVIAMSARKYLENPLIYSCLHAPYKSVTLITHHSSLSRIAALLDRPVDFGQFNEESFQFLLVICFHHVALA